ncbi:Hypothetical Protein OBI_RACECAR_75 [Arthrobacter phage Racecar]|nr:hypothetical protein PBI_RACECAR_157 [Arthrobacter phage Racecar]
MPPKAPNMSLRGVVSTDDAVQYGCVACLALGLSAPAENHVAYMWAGTSYCGDHLKAEWQKQVAHA